MEEKTSDVVLNVAEGLKLLPATLAVLGETFKQEKTSFNKVLNQLTIKFPVTLAPGSSVRLRVPFTDNLTDLATGEHTNPESSFLAKLICCRLLLLAVYLQWREEVRCSFLVSPQMLNLHTEYAPSPSSKFVSLVVFRNIILLCYSPYMDATCSLAGTNRHSRRRSQ